MVIFAILTLLIHESIIYFHLLIFFQIMSSVTSIFYPTSFSLTWLELFQVFYVIWSYYKRCCFHNFFLSTLVYMKDTDFCVFFSQAILLEEFINCWNFLSDFLMFLMYATILSTNKILWLLLFQFLFICYSSVMISCTS